MSKFAKTILVLMMFAITGVVTAAGAQTFDLSKDFSFSNDPNGVWQYGYSATNSLALNQFQLDTFVDTSYPIGFWHPGTGSSNYYPYIAENPTNATLTDATDSWAARAGEVAMEASNSGQYSLVRFVAPQTGTYLINAAFEGIHFRLSTTDVHVLLNGAFLFDGNIDGYGGDPAYHIIQGASPNLSYSGVALLQKDDIITFAVGYGANQTNFNDTTGLFASIQIITPEPGILPFAMIGTIVGASWLRRRRNHFKRRGYRRAPQEEDQSSA